MSVTHGICDFGYDATSGGVVDAPYVAHTKAMGVGLVRGTIATAPDGSIDSSLLRRAIETWGAAGVEVHAEFTPAFLPTPSSVPAGAHANMILNLSGDRFNSPFIDAVTLRAEGVGRQAYKSGLRTCIFGNEPNELLLPPGEVATPGSKGGALNPGVAAALYWQAAHRLASVGLQTYCGALSVLPQTGTNVANPYYAKWLEAFYASCAQHGKHAPFPWAGWAVNIEGSWTPAALNQSLAVLRGVMAAHGDTGTIRLTEWGWGAGPSVDPVAVDETMSAIDQSEVLSACYFQGPGQVPYTGDPKLYKGKGAWQWVQDGTRYIAGADYAWATCLRPQYARRAAVAAGA